MSIIISVAISGERADYLAGPVSAMSWPDDVPLEMSSVSSLIVRDGLRVFSIIYAIAPSSCGGCRFGASLLPS
jgi:hypothetical protein